MTKAAVSGLEALVASKACEAQKARRERLKARLAHSASGLGQAYKLLKGPPPRKLSFLATPQGISADPQAVDRAAREVWGDIYRGNSTDRWRLAEEFAQKYEPYMHPEPEWTLCDITGDQVFRAYTQAKHTAAGLDAWA
eukprot:10602240-Alexandrium_andersonii.AAC.1